MYSFRILDSSPETTERLAPKGDFYWLSRLSVCTPSAPRLDSRGLLLERRYDEVVKLRQDTHTILAQTGPADAVARLSSRCLTSLSFVVASAGFSLDPSQWRTNSAEAFDSHPLATIVWCCDHYPSALGEMLYFPGKARQSPSCLGRNHRHPRTTRLTARLDLGGTATENGVSNSSPEAAVMLRRPRLRGRLQECRNLDVIVVSDTRKVVAGPGARARLHRRKCLSSETLLLVEG